MQGDERKKAKVTRRLDVPISENVCGGITPVELSQAQEKELQLAQQDTKMERTKDRRNSLESYVYETRNKVLLQNPVLWASDFGVETRLVDYLVLKTTTGLMSSGHYQVRWGGRSGVRILPPIKTSS